MPAKRVAILSPVAWRTPPRKYGAWETVASNITEGLVARGWDVTLFATRDSVTRAHLHAVIATGYEEDSTVDPKVAEYLHISEMFEHAGEFVENLGATHLAVALGGLLGGETFRLDHAVLEHAHRRGHRADLVTAPGTGDVVVETAIVERMAIPTAPPD